MSEGSSSSASSEAAAAVSTEVKKRDMHDMENNTCRMYEPRFPQVDDLVIVEVMKVTDAGAYVRLLEYNDIEGMILLSELSRRRIRSINKLIRVGKQEFTTVLRVDTEKGYIDLSKRRVSKEDIAVCKSKFEKSKKVHSILRHVSEVANVRLDYLYETLGWPLYKQYGHAYDAFKLVVQNEEKVLSPFKLEAKVKEQLLKNIRRKLTPLPTKVRSEVEVTCLAYEGIDAIKKALTAGEACSTDTMPVTITLLAPPTYVLTTTAPEKEAGIAALNKAIEQIQTSIKNNGGKLTVKNAPRAVNDRDDRLLTELMEQMEKKNAEVSGDDG